MYIQHVDLRDFRSWPELKITLSPGVTVFVGRNGFGKTNIVEAIGYLAHLSSHRVSTDAPMVRSGTKDARVSATVVNHGRELTAHLLLKPHAANLAQLNRTRLQSPRELLGVLRTVLFAPEDLALVRGEPAERRRYVDDIMCIRQPRLAGVRADYEKVLRQRNALLKTAGRALRSGYDSADGAAALSTLDVWDQQLSHLGAQLIAARIALLGELAPAIHAAYAAIAPESRTASVEYQSKVDLRALGEAKEETLIHTPSAEAASPDVIEALMLSELGALRNKEIDRGVSLAGPHRDDIVLRLGQDPAKGFASHGETWSFALSLRLAEFELLKRDAGSDPVLILDDVFAELDAKRREKLVHLAAGAEQVLITAAVDEDLPGNLGEKVVHRFLVTVEDHDGQRISRIEEQESPQ